MRPLLALLPLVVVACTGGTTDTSDDDTDTDTEEGSTDTEPQLPAPAEPKAYSGDACPTLDKGTVTGFESAGRQRELIVRLPTKKKDLGVLFLWHGNGDTMENFDAYMGGQSLANDLGVIVIVPEAGAGGLGLDWAVPPNTPNPDATFFDDVLACLAEQHDLDLSRVYTAGFSAGALWSSWLVMNRADHLAAAVIFSGGSDGSLGVGPKVNPYKSPAWEIPVVMTHGGSSDQVVVNFKPMTESMAEQLREDGSTAIVCPHTQGHTPPSGFAAWAWPFLDAHRYGLSPSPYAKGKDPSGKLPDSCAWK